MIFGFKNKKDESKKKAQADKVSKKPVLDKEKKVKDEVKEAKAEKQEKIEEKPAIKTVKAEAKIKRDIRIAPSVLKHPHITEKATFLQELNQYVFRVFDTAGKQEIKKSVEEVYNVNVENVRIVLAKSKKRRLGRTSGIKPGYKKAIVKLKKGQTIELLPR